MLRFSAQVIIALAVIPCLVPRISAAEDLASGPMTFDSEFLCWRYHGHDVAALRGRTRPQPWTLCDRGEPPSGGRRGRSYGCEKCGARWAYPTRLSGHATRCLTGPAARSLRSVTDFEPIATLFDLLNFVAVPPDSPANTIPQILDFGKKSTKGLTIGSAGLARLRTSTASSFPSTTDYRSRWCSTVARFR